MPMSDISGNPIGAVIGAGGGILSTALGAAFASHQQDKAFKQQVELWNMNNEYNKPVNQKKRLEEAGINPYMAMTGDHGATMGNAPSPASADMSGIQKGAQGISDYFARERQIHHEEDMAQASTRKDNAEAEGIEIENKGRAAKQAAEIDELKSRARSNKAKSALDEWQQSLNNLIQDDVVKSYHLNNEMARRDIDLKDVQIVAQGLENELKRLHIKNASAQMAAELALMASQTYAQYAAGANSHAQAGLAAKQAEWVVKQKAKTICEANGIRWDNQLKARMMPYLVENQRLVNGKVQSETTRNWFNMAYPSSPLQFGAYNNFAGELQGEGPSPKEIREAIDEMKKHRNR